MSEQAPASWNDVASGHDFSLLRVELQALRSDLRAEMHDGFSRLLMVLVTTMLASTGAVLAMLAAVR